MARHKTRKSAAAAAAAAAASSAAGCAGEPRRRPMAIDLDPPETLTRTPSPSPPDPPPPIAVPDDSPAAAVPDGPARKPPIVVPDDSPPAAAAAAAADAPARKPPIKRKKPGTGRKPKPATAKKLAAIQSKLDFLSGNLRPFPFVPGAAPDLTRHAALFRALHLYDFLHLNLPADPLRPDLLAPLIASYNPSKRCSDVHNFRISVSRADIARALALPVPKKSSTPVDSDNLPLFAGEEAAAALSEFILNWLVVLEDAGEIPPAALAAMELVKEGQAYKVDWAGLVWAMVEKDLQEALKSGACYYAAHLQRLIKQQRPEVFEAEEVGGSDTEPEMLVEVVPSAEEEEEEDAGNASPGGEEDGTGNGAPDEAEDGNANSNVNADDSSLEGFQDVGTDLNGPQLSLRLGSEVDAMLGLDDCDIGGEPSWLTGGNDVGPSHFLQRCTMNDITAVDDDFGKEREDKDERAEEGYGREFDAKIAALGRMNSTDLLQAVSDANVSYDMPQHTVHGDFLSVATEAHTNMAADSHPASPFSFGNSCKRHSDEIDDEEVHPFTQLNPQKRVRSEGAWEGTTSTLPGSFEFQQAQCWIDKAKMVNMQAQQAYNNAQMELQYASNMLQQKDQVIQTLEKARMEEAQKREAEASRFEHELRLLTRVVSGYKKALRVSRNAFEEYRKKFPQVEEPYYKDVEGAGGLVLSASELERLQLMKEEEEMHDAAEEERLKNEKKMRDAAEEERLENEKEMHDAVKEERLEKGEEMRDAVKEERVEKEEEMRDATEVERFEKDEEMHDAAEVERFEKDEEMRAKLIANFAEGWYLKFAECEKRIGDMTTKFMKLKEDLNGLKEIHANTKVSETK